MKWLIQFFLPFYVHNKNLTKKLTWKKKVGFCFFYLDRFVYSPLFQSILKNKTWNEKTQCKPQWLKHVFLQLGLVQHDSTQKNKKLVEENVQNDNKSEKNCQSEKDHNSNGDIVALWPKRIYYATPYTVQKKKIEKKFNVIYIGHLSVLIQTTDFNILIDPVLSNIIGMYNILGIRRIIQAGITLNNLPNIDFVLLSNNRYDTMDKRFLKKLILRDNSIILGGMNIRRYLFKRNFPVVYPLDWFDKISFENITFHYLPTRSNSHRFLVDKNVYLPGSFLIQDNKGSIFYSGHTSYSEHFLNIQEYAHNNVCNLDLSILPMGIYKPRTLYKHFHMSPREALQAHLDLKSKRCLGIGHDVFCLGGEKYGEARKELDTILSSCEQKKKEKINFITLEPGQNIMF